MRQWIEEQGRGEFDADLACTGMDLDRDMAERSENCPKFADVTKL
jgi:hypothetical protein